MLETINLVAIKQINFKNKIYIHKKYDISNIF